MAKVAYYPGCALEGSGGPYDRSTRALVAALGLKMENLADWNCCGAMEVKNIHPMLQTYMSARNLAIAAERMGFDTVMAPCNGCYHNLKKAEYECATSPETLQTVQDLARKSGDPVYMQMSGKQDIEFINAVVMLTGNIILNLWLIPIYGILGAAIATGIAFASMNAARILEAYILLGIHPYDRSYHKPFVAALIVVLLAVFLSTLGMARPYWIINMAILCIAYCTVLYALGLEYEDELIWKTIKRKINIHTSIKACS